MAIKLNTVLHLRLLQTEYFINLIWVIRYKGSQSDREVKLSMMKACRVVEVQLHFFWPQFLMEVVVKITPWLLTTGSELQDPLNKRLWVWELMWTFWRTEKSFVPAGIQTMDGPVYWLHCPSSATELTSLKKSQFPSLDPVAVPYNALSN